MPDLHFVLINNYVYAKYNAWDADARVSLKIRSSREDFDAKKFSKADRRKMDRIKVLVNDYVSKQDVAGNKPSKFEIEKLIRDDLGTRTRKTGNGSVNSMLAAFRAGITSGDILHRKKRYSASILHIFKTLASLLNNVPALGERNIGKVSERDIDAFKKYLLDKDLAQNTLYVYVRYLLVFLKRTHKLGWHNNKVYEADDLSVPAEEIDTAVYLTTEEIMKVYGVEYVKHKKAYERSKDIFVFGCLTGLRFSDLERSGEVTLNNGILAINTKKKGKTVNIPVGALATEIWNKYQGDLKPVTNHVFNPRIRELCRLAGIDTPSLWAGTRGGEKKQGMYKKYELCGTHTMRRSFATNAYLAGVPMLSIMRITGHKTEASFLKYIRITNEENALLMQKHPHFM